MPIADINLTATIVAALLSMVVGFVWYSTQGFGKPWMKETGLKMKDAEQGSGSGYALTMAGALVEAFVLAHFIDFTNSTTWVDGAVTGMWIWVGFVAYALGVNYIFAKRSFNLWLIDSGYFLVLLMLQGAVLAVWR